MTREEQRDAAMRALARADPKIQAATLSSLSEAQRRELLERWERWAHAGQVPTAEGWRIWLILAGRGFGKTRAAAEWVSDYARRHPDARIALVGATIDDVQRVMVGGEGAGGDMKELRELLAAWRDAKRSAARAAIGWVVRMLLALVLVGVAMKTGFEGWLR